MNMSFYSAAVGAQQQQLRMNIQGNNIANVNTYGFRAEKVSFGELMNRNVVGIDEERLPKGCGTRVIQAQIDHAASGYRDTGRQLDFAITGAGYFALYDIESGEVSFSRDGAFMKARFLVETEDGGEPVEVWRLSDNEGRCVLDADGNFITLEPDTYIGNSKVPDDHFYHLEELNIGIFDYAIHEGFQHLDSTRFLATEQNGQLYMGTGKIKQGMLELSNTDMALEFTKVIESQRAYSFCLKMMTATDEIETTINGLRN